LTTSKDISGGAAPSHQCHVQITGKGGVSTCKHKGTYVEEGKHWCPLHAPSNVAKKKARKEEARTAKAAERATKLAEKQAPLDGDGDVAAVSAVTLPETVAEAAKVMVDCAQEAQVALATISNMTCKGWPENTPAENYQIMLQTINDEAQKCSDEIRLSIAKARKILDPVAASAG
jgi:hypothetical protein